MNIKKASTNFRTITSFVGNLVTFYKDWQKILIFFQIFNLKYSVLSSNASAVLSSQYVCCVVRIPRFTVSGFTVSGFSVSGFQEI